MIRRQGTSRELGRIARRIGARERARSAAAELSKADYADCELLREAAVAGLLKVHRDTLYNWRAEKIGPPAIRIGKRIRYPRAGLVEWLQKQERVV